MKLLLVRHGKTEWNKEKRAAGLTDIELNEEGIKQAEELREKLKFNTKRLKGCFCCIYNIFMV